MRSRSPDKVCALYSRKPPKIKVQVLPGKSEDDSHPFVLIEGSSTSLKMLGEIILATAEQKGGFDFGIDPGGAGCIFFAKGSTHGIYLNLASAGRRRSKRP